ncbi:hypothetical protein GCM10028805_41260 [Spirosoma harenae]
MRSSLLIIGVGLGIFTGFTYYCMALADWVQDYKTGKYAANYTKAILETAGLIGYTLSGLRFYKWRLNQ